MVFCPSPKKSGPETELECWRLRIAFACLTIGDHAPVAVPAIIGRSGTSDATIWNLGPSPPSRMEQW